LIKTVLALEKGMLPPSLNFKTPNPQINFAGSPFYVNDKLQPWDTNGAPRRAGVSSFGVGGTNAHVVLEEAPAREASGPSRPYQLVLVSARSSNALENATTNLANHLKAHPDLNPADVTYTLAGRRAFAHRRVQWRATGEAASPPFANGDPSNYLITLNVIANAQPAELSDLEQILMTPAFATRTRGDALLVTSPRLRGKVRPHPSLARMRPFRGGNSGAALPRRYPRISRDARFVRAPVAAGTGITPGPPHKSVPAAFRIRLLPRVSTACLPYVRQRTSTLHPVLSPVPERWHPFPLASALRSTNSAADRSALFAGFTAIMSSSDFPRPCIIGDGCSPALLGAFLHPGYGLPVPSGRVPVPAFAIQLRSRTSTRTHEREAGMRVGRPDLLIVVTLAGVAAMPALGQDVAPAIGPAGGGTPGAASIPDFSGIWAHLTWPDVEPPPAGPGPVTNRSRVDGVSNVYALVGDYTNPILKPQAAETVKHPGHCNRSAPHPVLSAARLRTDGGARASDGRCAVFAQERFCL
jgi:hypothetical protein